MSEERAIYRVGDHVLPETLEAFRNHPSALPYTAPGFRLPTPQELKQLRNIAGWSQTQIAKLVGAPFQPKKGSTTVRKWQTDANHREHREIPYAAWRLLLLYAGVVTVQDGLNVVDPQMGGEK